MTSHMTYLDSEYASKNRILQDRYKQMEIIACLWFQLDIVFFINCMLYVLQQLQSSWYVCNRKHGLKSKICQQISLSIREQYLTSIEWHCKTFILVLVTTSINGHHL